MPFYRIQHITRYTYPTPVIDGANQIMLYPLKDATQEVLKHEIQISGKPNVEEFTDYFGNKIGVFTIIKPHSELVIQSNMEVVTKTLTLPNDEHPAAAQWEHLQSIKHTIPYMDFLNLERFAAKDEITTILQKSTSVADTPLALVGQLAEYVFQHFEYRKGVTSVETNVDEIWKLKAGVCQDFAHILLVMLRMKGIPARYVSGYICPKDQELRGEGATHAWVEAYLPFYGWLGIDPTNNCFVSDRHVRLAIGRSFSDCTPVKGTYKGAGEHTLEVSVVIENGTPKPKSSTREANPTYTYTSKKDTPVTNSYQEFIEMQQQQQQQ